VIFRPDRPDLDLSNLGAESLVLDPEYLDGAVIGVHAGRVVYDYDLIVDCYVANNEDKNLDTWQEFVDFNTIRAIPYYGEQAPIVVSSDPWLVEEHEQEEDAIFITIDNKKRLVVGD